MNRIKLIPNIVIVIFGTIFLNLYAFTILIRSLRPHEKVQKGDKFLVIKDFQIDVLTHYHAPFTDGFKCKIPKGTLIEASWDAPKVSLGFTAVPIDYEEFETKFVPIKQREFSKYSGYSLVVRYNKIGKHLTRAN